MKRSTALVLTIIIFAAIAVCFLRPADPNPDFGYVPNIVMIGGDGKSPIGECVGDTDVVRLTQIDYDVGSFVIYYEASRTVVNTTASYTDGNQSNGKYRAYTIERLEDGEWKEIGFGTSSTSFGTLPYVLCHAGEGSLCFVPFPEFFEAGKYRFTYYFRELLDTRYGHQSTGQELYTVSHTIDVPKSSDKPFDLISTCWNRWDKDETYDGDYMTQIALTLRHNTEKALYTCGAEMETLRDGRWEAYEPEKPISFRNGIDIHEDGATEAILLFYDFAPPTDYRAVFHFTENEDGSGERYTLTLRFHIEN